MNTDEQSETGVHSKSGRKVAGLKSNPATFAKTDQRFWQQKGRLFKEKGSAAYSCRIQFAGDRLRFGLGTSNKDAAAAKAASIYHSLITDGKEETLTKFKPKTAEKADVSTVGEWIAETEKHCTLFSATMQNYVSAVRKLAGDIGTLPRNKSRFSYKTGGTAEWRAAVDKLPLSVLSSANVNAWQVSYRKSKPASPEAQRKALNSARSTVRNAKALFGVKIAKALRDVAGLTLPDPLPMADVSLTEIFGKKTKTRYQSRIDAEKLLRAASLELVQEQPEAFKVLVLGLCCGLRKREIDCLLWRQVDFDAGMIRVEATEHFRPKSEDSAGDVDLDPELVALLRQWKETTKGEFVIAGRDHTNFKSRVSYRCETVYSALYAWLRKHGVSAQKALHELRKEAGALVAKTAGIYAASRLLRHSDIRVTADFYADKKQRISTGLGALLPAENVIAFPGTAEKAALSKQA
ncbi:MAG: tyrosine-type recombinase/integrase [Verrucomicrobiaceae bacterium]|nr:tyrosine-type recombinase/integrase [Verrucomicrobiaceae bacterium]